MTKHDLAGRVTDVCQVSDKGLKIDRATATAVINATLAVIANAVTRGESVTLREFGTFEPKIRAAKTARNISAGVTMSIPEHTVPHFKPSNGFKLMVREGTPTNQS